MASIDRIVFTSSFKVGETTPWHCPTCGKGLLEAREDHTLKKPTKASNDWYKDSNGDIGGCTSLLTVILKCNNNKCGDVVSMLGSLDHPIEYDSDGFSFYAALCKPLFFSPPLSLFCIPSRCPESVRCQIKKAFALYLYDKESSANRVRSAIESLMDEERVPKISHQKKRFLPLHARLERWAKKRPKATGLADKLKAVKWIGNEGTHGNISIDDVFDAFDIMQHVLEELYDSSSARIGKIAGEINKKSKPRSKIASHAPLTDAQVLAMGRFRNLKERQGFMDWCAQKGFRININVLDTGHRSGMSAKTSKAASDAFNQWHTHGRPIPT